MIDVKWQEYDGRPLVVGTLILWKSGSISLIGDVNENLGVCDDCTTDKCDFSTEGIYYNKVSELYNDGKLEEARSYKPREEWLKTQIDKVFYIDFPDFVFNKLLD